jgi:DNA-binding response OmpR family regulator
VVLESEEIIAKGAVGEPAARAPVCMIVEDEAAIALALEDEFRDAGYDVSGPFATCAAALIKLGRDRPDVAILDTVLKDGSCLELASALKRRGVPFVIFSGWEEMHQNAPELAGAPWIVKPAEFATVRQAIERLAAGRDGAGGARNEAAPPPMPVI